MQDEGVLYDEGGNDVVISDGDDVDETRDDVHVAYGDVDDVNDVGEAHGDARESDDDGEGCRMLSGDRVQGEGDHDDVRGGEMIVKKRKRKEGGGTMVKEGSPGSWRASSLKGISSIEIKQHDTLKFNDMVKYSGTEVGSVMGLVNRFEINGQGDVAIQNHQAGLGGLKYEKS